MSMLLVMIITGIVLWLLANFLLKDLYFSSRFYVAGAWLTVLFFTSYFAEVLYKPALILLAGFLVLTVTDILLLFFTGKTPDAGRSLAERLSNGDQNPVTLTVRNHYGFRTSLQIIDELPEQFQAREHVFKADFRAHEEKQFTYKLRPVERGEYAFGNIVIYAGTIIGMTRKRMDVAASRKIPVYPSYVQMRKYDLKARRVQSQEPGTKKLRRLGFSLEFEHIKDYTRGDDIRLINWKATARKNELMVNNFLDERSQQVYCVIDKGRLMKMPFANLSLLDYAINTSLVLCNVCLRRHDRFGLLTFSDKPGNMLHADKKPAHMQEVLRMLYRQSTHYLESDFDLLYKQIRTHIRQRSLLILFTNFESMSGMQRQLPYLRMIARYHLLMVVFFENTELKTLTEKTATDTEGVYVKTIAEKFTHEKRVIVKELQNHAILSVLTPPENLTLDTVNKYLELKSRQAI